MTRESGEFYIGYLPDAPAQLARSTRGYVRRLIALGLVVAALTTLLQGSFSRAVFEFGVVRRFEGWLTQTPYPSLLVARPGGGHSRYLLTRFGKWGIESQSAPFATQYVRLEGSLIYRDDQTMIEVADGTLEVAQTPSPAPALERWSEDLGDATLVGEIVDSKCFLGVMKPGRLKPHRACATRCLSGGVPPVLLVRDPSGNATYLLLVSADGAPVGRTVVERDLVAEPVEIRGRVLRYDNQLVLRADPQDYRRVPSTEPTPD